VCHFVAILRVMSDPARVMKWQVNCGLTAAISHQRNPTLSIFTPNCSQHTYLIMTLYWFDNDFVLDKSLFAGGVPARSDQTPLDSRKDAPVARGGWKTHKLAMGRVL
jgi:hypothetical protein